MKRKLFGPPGTGKTTILVRFVVKLMTREKDPIAPESICFITHTTKGKREIWQKMSERYEKITGRHLSIDQDTPGFESFRTIHGLCSYSIKNSGDFKMATQKDFKKWYNAGNDPDYFIKTFGDSYKENEIIKFYSYMRSRQMDFDQAFLVSTKRTLNKEAYRRKEVFKHYLESWIGYKLKNNLYEFIDQLLKGKEKNDFNDYRVLVIDEAQDSSKLQWEIADLIRERHSLDYQIFAGDDDQAIFNFSGGDEQEFLNRYGNEFKPKILRTSYRLSQENIELANAVSRNYIKRRQDKKYFARSRREKSDPPVRTDNIDRIPLDEGNWTIQCAVKRILTNDIAPEIQKKGLWYKKHVHVGGSNEVQESYHVSAELLRAVRFYLKMQKGEKVGFDELSSYRGLTGKSILESNPLFSKQSVSELDTKKDQIANNKQYDKDFIVKKFGLNFNQPLIDHFDTHLSEAKSKSLKWRTEYDPTKTVLDCRDYIERCLKNNQDLLSEPKIKLSTIHAMKGGEDDNIVVIEDMGTAFFNQFMKGPTQYKDEVSRMFYTGITRVKEKLFILSLGTGKAFPFREIFNELYNKKG
tara:strand:- start:2021 stop:3763 length:1743 start_codon:yes stop_codon:yes gene_type:complete